MRENKLNDVLSHENNIQKLTNYEHEEVQIKLDLSDMILNFLVEETAILLNTI